MLPLKWICCCKESLTLVLLNKLRCHTHFLFSANQSPWSRFWRSQLIWIYNVCKDGIFGFSRTRVNGQNDMQERPCFILISLQDICFGHLLELPHWGDSNKYPKHMLLEVLMQYSFIISVTSWAKVSWHSNCHYNEFCHCIECRYKEDCLYSIFP